MLRKMFLIGTGLGIALLISSSRVGAKNLAKPEPVLTISVYNGADVPRDTLQQAEKEAARVFRKAGIEVKWQNCEAPAESQVSVACREAIFPAHLHVRIARKPLRAKDGVLGISFLGADGRGCQADLFYERMEDLTESSHGSLASLLGHVAAHEVGHLLLGTNSHAAAGIMQAHWTGDKLVGLYFSPAESARMRKRLAAGIGEEKRAPRLAEASADD